MRFVLIFGLVLSLTPVFSACDDDDTEHNGSVCGNGIIEEGEVCDGTQLDSATCNDLLPNTGGTVLCNDTCQFDTTDCVACSCGDGIRCGDEECDTESFGEETCETRGDFTGGELSCSADCTIETSSCVPDCEVLSIGNDCDTGGGSTECCPILQPSGQWDSVVCRDPEESGTGRCQPLPVDDTCGWGLTVDSSSGDICDFVLCGEGNGSTPANSPCDLGERSGWCQPSGAAMEQSGTCIESGTREHGETCIYVIPWDLTGVRGVDPDSQCLNGGCASSTGDGTGVCISYCDPTASLQGNDSCPQDWNCANWSWLEMGDLNESVPQYFRGADNGFCMPQGPGMSEVFVNGGVMCDVLTGLTTKGGAQCPDGEACFVESNSHTMGMC
ncbi:hypothetical protein KJ865_12485, partial [Myxococcota bacterium]|nr:hypothetical protein [Myxococcota bacterium]